MDFKTFKKYSEQYSLIPVYEIVTADLLTPVLAYLKIREKNSQSFLLESVEGNENLARYSFIGKNPTKVFSNRGIEITEESGNLKKKFSKIIFDHIRDEFADKHQLKLPELPSFTGGMVGYLGYENVNLIEPVLNFKPSRAENPDSIFGIYHNILAFDHLKHQIILIANVDVKKGKDLKSSYEEAKTTISDLKTELKKPLEYSSDFRLSDELKDNFDRNSFYSQVEECKRDITDGEIFQIVLSKKFSAKFSGDIFNVYRALRIINPSPYMYYLEFKNNFRIVGTSPEDLLKVNEKKATLLPIAGTRRRGKTDEEDNQLENDLLNDPKEIAEHTMLVDLGRNDLGKVCEFGSVKIVEDKVIQRYSHVMHIVSKIEGIINENSDSINALKSCFPAGTVSGAPKIRAMQLIAKYENDFRNVYAGAVGYLDFSQNLDMCIAIRTLYSNDDKIFWQAGAGIVADSKPELETKEILNKAEVLKSALKYAEEIDENTGN